MSMLLAAGIGAGAGLIAGGSQRRHEKRMANTQFNYDMEMAKYAYSKDLEMWNLQNQYNSPSAQMDRYRAAGLNPHLVATRGSSGNATTMPQYQQVRSQHGSAGSGIQEGLQMAHLFADLKIKNAQADNISTNTQLTDEQIVAQGFTNRILEMDIEFKKYDLEYARWWNEGLAPSGTYMEYNNKNELIGARNYRDGFIGSKKPRLDQAIKEYGAKLKFLEGENAFQGFRKRLNDKNISVTDPALERVLYDVLKSKGWLEDDTKMWTLLMLLLRNK